MQRFKRYYKTSAFVTVGMLGVGTIGLVFTGFGSVIEAAGTLLTLLAALIPIWRQGGIESHLQTAISISVGFSILFAGLTIINFLDFLRTHGEGPNGEGSPLAFIIAMAFFALIFLCPWLLTALRGIALWKHQSQAEQAAT